MLALIVGITLLAGAFLMIIMAPESAKSTDDGRTQRSIEGWYAAGIVVLLAIGIGVAVSGVLSFA